MTLQDRIVQELVRLGVPRKLRGFQYLCKAVELVVEDERYLYKLNGCLYPDVAKCFDMSPNSVGATMRHAIDCAMRTKEAQETFGCSTVRVPHFITKVAELVKQDVVVPENDVRSDRSKAAKELKWWLDTNTENGVVWVPDSVVQDAIKALGGEKRNEID